jgi:hypothetical protein
MPGLWPGILRFGGGLDDWADGIAATPSPWNGNGRSRGFRMDAGWNGAERGEKQGKTGRS